MKRRVLLNKRYKYLVVFYLILVLLFLFNITFSKFISKTNGDTSIDVAKFSFDLKSNGNTLSDNFTYNLASNITNGSNLSNKIVPGQSGSIDLVIDLSGSEVATKWSIYVDPKQKIPDNLKFYSDSLYNNEVYLGGNAILTDINNLSDAKIVNKSIYWKWIFDEDVVENDYEGTDLLFDIKVLVSQYLGGM